MCHLRLSVMHKSVSLSLHLDVPGLARLQVPGVHFTDGWGGESVTHGSPAPSKDKHSELMASKPLYVSCKESAVGFW